MIYFNSYDLHFNMFIPWTFIPQKYKVYYFENRNNYKFKIKTYNNCNFEIIHILHKYLNVFIYFINNYVHHVAIT